ncbi:MAG: ATP-dependent zinc metalloprotease FtsH [Bacillota bacterium]|nr:ATP-dependent zinc metalloprotease FtsH [Bacillota bacterium]
MRKILKGSGVYVVLALTILLIYWLIWDNTGSRENWPISKTIIEIENGSVNKISIKNNTLITGETTGGKQFDSYIPYVLKDEIGKVLYQKATENKMKIEGEQPQERSILLDLLPMVFTVLVFGLIWFLFMQNSAGGGSKAMSFGKSKAKLHKAEKGKRVLFADVAGLKEEKEELYELVDFLKNPAKYNSLGARIPKGVLMVGRPGTGKTYLSRAVAGEAGVPFFSISGSDFVEMFVGVGASRVRDMFENAKKNAPCIIFIDEIDAVGRRRGAGLGGGHDEREQTLNQLLVEMDGFSDNQGIIIMAATNRPDILDPALLRPGRFDREIMIGLPDIEEREQILQIHSRNKPVAPHVDFKVIARGTPGFTPADLENVLNEAAILSARKNESQITENTIEEATTKIIAGVEKKSRVITEKERKLTAFHEGGHAVVGRVLMPENPIHQVTIIPRGMAGGFTLQLPLDERYYKSKTEIENEICVLLGGRMGEKLVMGDISTGASNDLEKVTKLARAMVTKYGMAEELSAMSYASDDDEVFLGKSMGHVKQNSEQVQAEIDRAVRRIVDTAYDKTEAILREYMPHLERVAEALLEFETIYNDEFEAAFSHGIEKVREVRANTRQKNKESMDEYNEKKAKEEAERKAFEERERAQAAAQEVIHPFQKPDREDSE